MSEQRLSVTFGAFSCDVVGYDDPFSILNRVVELFNEIAKANPAFGAGEVGMSDMERAKLAAGLSEEASRIEELADASAPNGVRYVVSNAEADLLDAPSDAPSPESVAEEAPSEDEVVIAAEADDGATGGDLELRDTLEAVDAPALPAVDEEVVALAVDPMASDGVDAPIEDERASVVEAVEPAPAPVASSEEDETVEIITLADESAKDGVVADVVSADELPEIPLDEEPLQEVAKETAAEDEPLRLNIGEAGLEPARDIVAADDVVAKRSDVTPEKPKPRVTVTRLPLRPTKKEQTEPPAAEPKHALTPVQKVEPVVTLNTMIAEPADETPKQSRAERLKAKMDLRDAEDDGENFLFADVGEAQPEEPAKGDTPRNDLALPLALTSVPEAAEEPAPEEETAKKPRRSLASLLGFGKKSEPTRPMKPVAEVEIPPVETIAAERGDADGFDRLRESVSAAMPAMDEPAVASPKPVAEPQSISEAIDYDDETSPTTFARRVGATTLQDLLEASAVYMDIVEGKSRFSRRDVMQALHQIDADEDYTQEARLKSFRKLLTTGSLVRVDDGMFTVSQATRYGYESQLQAS